MDGGSRGGSSEPLPIRSITDQVPVWDIEITTETETETHIIREISVSEGGAVYNERIEVLKTVKDAAK
jgi:hypothetical protein